MNNIPTDRYWLAHEQLRQFNHEVTSLYFLLKASGYAVPSTLSELLSLPPFKEQIDALWNNCRAALAG